MKHHITNKKRKTRQPINPSKRHEKKTRKKAPILKDNFYYFVNKGWFSNTFISESDTDKSNFSIMQKKVNNELYKCVTKFIPKEKTIASLQCKHLYTALTNWNDRLVENQIYLYIKQINDFRKNETNLYLFLKWSIYNGFITPIDFGVITDLKKSRRQIATVGENGFTFTVKDMYFNKHDDYVRTREYYVKFIQAVFSLFFGDNNTYSAKDVFDIELELATKMYTVNDYVDLNKTYNRYSNKEAKRYCNFDLNLFLKEFGMTNVHHINFINPAYIKHAFTLMIKENWTSIKWNSYWVYKLLVSVSMYHSKLHRVFFDFFTYKLKGISKEEPRSVVATVTIANIMNATVSKTYIRHYKNAKEIEFAKDMVSRIIKVFKERLTKNAWLSQPTKEYALNKIDKLVYAIGYKDNYPEDPDCLFLADDAVGNSIKYSNWVFDQSKRNVNKPIPNNSYWFKPEEMNVFDVNAFYSNTKNEFILPNAILQKPFIDLSKKISYNFAYIGFIIAHEIIHGFDSHGSTFDETGILSTDWWTKEDLQNYKLLQDDVKDHYKALAKKDGIEINADLTLNENIADISAMALIEDALETYLFEHNIFGEKQNEYFKDLYYNYARQWRNIIRPKQLRNRLLLDQHSLSKYRVNCVLMRSKRFNTIFNITQKDGMFFSDKTKEIW